MNKDTREILTDYLDDFIFEILRNDYVFHRKLSDVLYYDLILHAEGKLSELSSEKHDVSKKHLIEYINTIIHRYVEHIRNDCNSVEGC